MAHYNTPPESRWFNQRLILHLAFWLVVYSGLLWFLRQDGWPVISRGNALILFLLLPLPVYLHFYMIERFFNRRKYPVYILLAATLIPIFAALFRALFSARMRQYNGLVSFIFILFSFLAVATGLKFLKANFSRRIDLERHQTRQFHNRLEAIKQAVNPRLTLNMLHHLSRLSEKNIERLPHAILLFSEYLRFALDSAKKDRVAVTEELRFLRKYLQLEEERLGFRFSLRTEKPARYRLPPLLLISLAETFISHLEAQQYRNPAVDLSLSAHKSRLEFEIFSDHPAGRRLPPVDVKPLTAGLSRFDPDRYLIEATDREGRIGLRLSHQPPEPTP